MKFPKKLGINTHTYICIYSFISSLDKKKHDCLWVNLEPRYEDLGYNSFFKHLGLSVSRPLTRNPSSVPALYPSCVISISFGSYIKY